MFSPLGTPSISATIKYFNDRKVPHLFAVSGVSRFSDPKLYPYTPSSSSRSDPTARSLSSTRTTIWAKTISPACAASSRRATTPVSWASYELTDPTVESQVIGLKASGAEILLVAGTPKFASQAIRKAYDIDWHPLHFLNNVSNSIGAVLQPAGPEKAVNIISTTYYKDATAAKWQDDADYKEWIAFMKKYNKDSDPADNNTVLAYARAYTLAQVLRQCGDDLTRENVMKQAANIKDLQLGGILPGIKVNTSATDFAPIAQLQLMKFKGDKWDLFGEIISGDVGG